MKNELVGKIIKDIVQKIMLRMMTILTGKQMAQKSVQQNEKLNSKTAKHNPETQ